MITDRTTAPSSTNSSVGGLSAAALAGVAGLVNAGKFSDTNA